jgi:hypothetical protein
MHRIAVSLLARRQTLARIVEASHNDLTVGETAEVLCASFQRPREQGQTRCFLNNVDCPVMSVNCRNLWREPHLGR